MCMRVTERMRETLRERNRLGKSERKRGQQSEVACVRERERMDG